MDDPYVRPRVACRVKGARRPPPRGINNPVLAGCRQQAEPGESWSWRERAFEGGSPRRPQHDRPEVGRHWSLGRLLGGGEKVCCQAGARGGGDKNPCSPSPSALTGASSVNRSERAREKVETARRASSEQPAPTTPYTTLRPLPLRCVCVTTTAATPIVSVFNRSRRLCLSRLMIFGVLFFFFFEFSIIY